MTIEITRDDLLAAGFVPWQYWGATDRVNPNGMPVQNIVTHMTYLVHGSVADVLKGKLACQLIAPVLIPLQRTVYHYESKLTAGATRTEIVVTDYWEAKWGAQYFRLRTERELRGFMELFKY